MTEPIISVSGLRGIVGESLTNEVVFRYAAAFAAGLPSGPIVITMDGRESGVTFLTMLCSRLAGMGRDVLSAGIAATPTNGVLVKQLRAAGGIQISASHNPAQYNGLKLFSAEGRVLPSVMGQEVLTRFRSRDMPAHSEKPEQIGKVSTVADTTSGHAELVMQIVDVERVRRRRFRVLLDANRGAGGVLGRRLLESLGCNVTILGGKADGRFDHPPEPTADNLKGVLADVTRVQADVGFCQDPDADRLAIIDADGRYLGEEYTFALCADHVLRRTPGPVVTNCSTSRMTEDLAKKYAVPFYRTAVGEANVVDAMLQHSAVLGGEGNGGVIDPRVVLVRDSFTAMALVLDAMAARELMVSALADELPRYEICKTTVPLPRDKLAAGFSALERHFKEAKPDRLDGLRLDWPDRWLLVRGSNTEPIVRAVAEAPTAAEATSLCHQAEKVMAAV